MSKNQDQELQDQIVEFWIGEDEVQRDPERLSEFSKRWYNSDEAFDNQIREKFGDLVAKAGLEQLLHWCVEPQGALAHVLLLDQFTRNIYRGTAEAYSFDVLARAIALRAYKRRLDEKLSVIGRVFLYHPFHHSELLADQEFSCRLIQELIDEAPLEWQDLLQSSQTYAESHCETIRQFSRFPHRNNVLGRKSTPEEIDFLKNTSRFGQ